MAKSIEFNYGKLLKKYGSNYDFLFSDEIKKEILLKMEEAISALPSFDTPEKQEKEQFPEECGALAVTTGLPKRPHIAMETEHFSSFFFF